MSKERSALLESSVVNQTLKQVAERTRGTKTLLAAVAILLILAVLLPLALSGGLSTAVSQLSLQVGTKVSLAIPWLIPLGYNIAAGVTGAPGVTSPAGRVGGAGPVAVGSAFRDKIADLLRKSYEVVGKPYTVRTEVSKWTPFGRRIMDIHVEVLGDEFAMHIGGLETKFGRFARYNPWQILKDIWLSRHGYSVSLIRETGRGK